MRYKENKIKKDYPNWEEELLGDILIANYGKSLPKRKRKEGNYKVYGSGGISGTHNDFLVEGPGIIIGRKGTVGSIYYEKNNYFPIDTTYYVEKKDNYDLKFLFYKLKTLGLTDMNTHSAVPGLNRENLYNIITKLPPLKEQKEIADILSTLDEKIETNNQINKNLEEMAQAIFKHWFVDFEFSNEEGQPYKSSGGEMVESELGMIPEGWEVGNIGNYAKVKSGYAFKSKFWEDKGIPVVKIKSIQDNTINFHDVSYVNENKISDAKEFLVKEGDVLIAMTGATIGKIGLVPKYSKRILVNQRVGKFFIGDKPTKKIGFLYGLLNNTTINDEIIKRGDGSAQPNVSPKQIETIKIPLPSNNIINLYNSKMESIFKLITKNLYEKISLSNLRDTLLPKLMSGEIRVPLGEEEIEEKVEQA